MTETEAIPEAPELGYQTPLAARAESLRANEILASATDVRWIEDGVELQFPCDADWVGRVERFAQEFGRRRPTREFEVLEDQGASKLELRIVGPGVTRWINESQDQSSSPVATFFRRRIRFDERFRSLTRNSRVLPNFFIIGAPRCGTTTLSLALSQHPSVGSAVTKELAFFNLLYDRGLDWYRGQFPTKWERAQRIRRSGAFATGDATPTYLFNPHAAKRIRQAIPDARLIVMLRDPIERAYSQYHWSLKMGYELLPFDQAVELEEERARGEYERVLADESYLSFPRSYLSYLAMGRYAEQIEAWKTVFPDEQFLFITNTEIKTQPHELLARILKFLDLPAAEFDFPLRNSGSYLPLADSTRQRLESYFQPHNERLHELLGRDPF